MTRIGRIVVTLVVLAGCRGLSPDRPAEHREMTETVDAVREYLRADDETADRLLPALARRPIGEIASATRRVLDEPPPLVSPTGMMPDRPLRIGDTEFRYALYVPPTYRADRRYPLIVCLHGAGFGGDAYLDRWQPRLKDDYLLACPTIEGGAWWTREAEALVLAVIADVRRAYAVDERRIMLTGMSNGGTGTFLIGLNHADRFAALAPMASALPRGLYPLLENARSVPFYVIHGSKDQIMPVQYSRDLVAHLQANGYSVVYREHDREHPMAGGHFFPKDELPALVGWLELQRRGPAPREMTVVRDRDHVGRSFWIRIDETTSGAASFWESERDPEESRRLQDGAFARLDAAIDGQTISVRTQHIARYTVLLAPDLCALNEPVRVITNGSISFDGLVQPDPALLLREARLLPDAMQLVHASLPIVVAP